MDQPNRIPVTASIIQDLIHPHILAGTETIRIDLLIEFFLNLCMDFFFRHPRCLQNFPAPIQVLDCIIYRRLQIIFFIFKNTIEDKL